MVSTPIEIETTILSGLPVRVTANIQPAELDVGIMYPWPEDVQIFWPRLKQELKKLCEVPQSIYDRMSQQDNELLTEQLMEEYHYGD